MKTKSFQQYLEKRLDKKEITEIEQLAELEAEALQTLQTDVSNAIVKYMKAENVGFNELTRRLDISPTQMTKIQKGQANLTLATIAHISALLKRRPHLVFR